MKQLATLKLSSLKALRGAPPTSRGLPSVNHDKFLDEISSAICSAWAAWQAAATMVGIVISGPVATGGQVVGPPLTPLILASGPKATPQEMKLTNAVANVIGTAIANDGVPSRVANVSAGTNNDLFRHFSFMILLLNVDAV